MSNCQTGKFASISSTQSCHLSGLDAAMWKSASPEMVSRASRTSYLFLSASGQTGLPVSPPFAVGLMTALGLGRTADHSGGLFERRSDLKQLTSTQIPGYPRTTSIAAGLDKLKAIPVCSPWVQAAETRRGQAHGYASTGFMRQTESGGLSIRAVTSRNRPKEKCL